MSCEEMRVHRWGLFTEVFVGALLSFFLCTIMEDLNISRLLLGMKDREGKGGGWREMMMMTIISRCSERDNEY
jgi:hypothetical protein